MRTYILVRSMALALVAFGAAQLFAKEEGSSPWYVSVAAGASTGWSADKQFAFGPRIAPGQTSSRDPFEVKARAKSKPVAALAFGYDWGKSEAAALRTELECLYQPQSYRMFMTRWGIPVPEFPGSSRTGSFERKTDDLTYFANIGLRGRVWSLPAYIVVGAGCNTSNAADTAAAFQAKGGVTWALTSGWSLNLETRFVSVPHFEIETAKWGIDSKSTVGDYDFGSVYSLSGMVGLQYRF